VIKNLSLCLVVMSMAGCATPVSVQRASDYEVCRLSLLRPPLQSDSAIYEADRQIKVRGLNCNSYAGTIYQQQQQGLNQLILMQQQQQQQQQQQIRTPVQTTCSRNGQFVNCTSY
jgi:hypothetical protein